MPLLAAIDQGTTGTRCYLFDLAGRIVASAYREHAQFFPQPGWVEHDAVEIRDNVDRVAAEAIAAAPNERVLGLGVTNQRETVVFWDAQSGLPLGPAIVWQDTRTDEDCREWIAAGLEPAVQERTGLPIRTYFSAPKIRWLLSRTPDASALVRAGRLRIGTMDSWVIWNLTGGIHGGAHVTDPTNASRTLLCALETLAWDPELVEMFGAPPEALARIEPSISTEPYGWTRADGPFRGRIPVCADLGDQQAALFGQACFRAGEAKNTYGSGSFLLQHTGAAPVASRHGLLATAAAARRGERAYALEGSVAVSGSAVQWLRDGLGVIDTAAQTETLARSVSDSGGVYFVPAFSGLFAPHWDMSARGTIVGLTRFATRAHLVRATLESMAYQSREVLDAMAADSGLPAACLKVDGGATENDFLMQLQADVLGIPVIRPAVRETTALGAAHAAGLACGAYGSFEEISRLWRRDRVFEPAWTASRREEGFRNWKRAVERSRGWVEERESPRI
ncbi:MAG: glycerol kinase GlpK [Acidobacteriota bacterium]